jgi:hypothetical protein
MGWFSRKPKPDPADVIRGLREQALTLDPATLKLTPTPGRPHVWGVLMETGYEQAAASLVAFADGTTSLYLSNGGGVIGAGEHAAVRQASEGLLSAAESHVGRFAPVPDTALPPPGRVRFVIRTFNGTLGAEVAEADLGGGAHPLSAVFFAAHGVITAIRETTPAR